MVEDVYIDGLKLPTKDERRFCISCDSTERMSLMTLICNDCVNLSFRAKAQWIKTTERLPELDQKVLIFFNDEIAIAERWYEYDSDNCCDSWRWYVNEYYEKILATHWIPLPEKPKVSK